jgi:hypothetical protein
VSNRLPSLSEMIGMSSQPRLDSSQATDRGLAHRFFSPPGQARQENVLSTRCLGLSGVGTGSGFEQSDTQGSKE